MAALSSSRSCLWLALSLTWLSVPAQGADTSKPHPHRGLVPPFSATPPDPTLTPDQEAKLAAHEPVLVQDEGEAGGRAVAVQDIQASPETIMGRIRDFRAYPRMVGPVTLCEPYLEDGPDVRVRFILKVVGLKYEYFIRHTFHETPDPESSYVTWTLDYDRESDLDESVGYWYVIPLREKPGWSRLFYSIDMRTRGWMPPFLHDMVAKKGLRDATAWVKRESEAEQSRSSARGA